MITQVVKRDGRVENFDPSKILSHIQFAESIAHGKVDMRELIMRAIQDLSGSVTTSQIQNQIIEALLAKKTWTANLVAGCLYASDRRKAIFPNGTPRLKDHYKSLVSQGYLRVMPFTDQEWDAFDEIIDHDLDLRMDHAQYNQFLKKYCLKDLHRGKTLETPQFEMARMAWTIASTMPPEKRVQEFRDFYTFYSRGIVNAPTPNHLYMGTPHPASVSCALFQIPDFQDGITAVKTIVDYLTNVGAGLGGRISVRSPGDPVQGGKVIHRGKFPYLATLQEQVRESEKAGRDGSVTVTFEAYDPEAQALILAQNPRTPATNQLRRMHFSLSHNHFFVKAAMTGRELFHFNSFTAPKLMEYYHDEEKFAKEYARLEADPDFEKVYFSPLELLNTFVRQTNEVSTLYDFNSTEVNRHTPWKEPVYNSNLCQEVITVSRPYKHVTHLFREDDHGEGEIGLCTLGAVNVADDLSDEDLKKACMLALKQIDFNLDNSVYPFPHMAFTARARRNAAVGMVGVATLMARKNLRYDTPEGLKFLDKLAERFSYFVIESALELGIERGNAPWIHKTKWPEGWLPKDTYNRHVDELVEPQWSMPWEPLRARIIANGGIRFSSLMALMPTESSSKALPGKPNGYYPVRELSLLKSDQSAILDWVAAESDTIGHQYQLAYDIAPLDMIKVNAVLQKHIDQSGSYDGYRDRIRFPSLKESDEINLFLAKVYYGQKTSYYMNSKIPNAGNQQPVERGCASGSCDV